MRCSSASIGHGGLNGDDMAHGSTVRRLLIGLSLSIVPWLGAAGQSTSSTEK
jgi:hypothetical protein